MPRTDWPPSAEITLGKIARRIGDLTNYRVSWMNPPVNLAEKVAFACTDIRTLQLVVSGKVRNRDAWHKAYTELQSKGICITFTCVTNVFDISTACPQGDLRVIIITGDEKANLAPLTPNCKLGMCFTEGKEAEWLKGVAKEWMATWLS